MSKKLIIILINFGLIVIITLMLIGQINQYKGVKDVIVAKTLIKKGVKITSDMLETKKITLNREATGVSSGKLVTYYNDIYKDTSDVVGKYAEYDLIPGEVVVGEKLSSQISANNGYLYNLPKGYYAYVLPNTIGAGIVQVNDYIDLYVYAKDQGLVEEPALRHLRVYDLRTKNGTQLTDKTNDTTTTDAADTQADYIVIGVNDYQLKKLIGYQDTDAVIKAALRRRPNSENEVIDNPEASYPYYAIGDGVVIDEATEQQMIDDNTKRISNEQKQLEGNSKKTN